MEDIKKAVDVVLEHCRGSIELMLDKALSGKEVKIRNASVGLGGSITMTGKTDTPNVNLLVGRVETVIGCKTGNLSDGMLVTLLVEVNPGLIEIECFHRNIEVLDSE